MGEVVIHNAGIPLDGDMPAGEWLRFDGALEVLEAADADQVPVVLARVEKALDNGFWAAGFLCYEAAPGIDSSLTVKAPAFGSSPLAWFGIFPPPASLPAFPSEMISGGYELGDWESGVEREDYLRAVERIRELIAAGQTYQVNYTYPLRACFEGDPAALFDRLRLAQQASREAYVNTGRFAALSASPELFFAQCGDEVVTRPMKGTAARGRWPGEDRRMAFSLAASEKDRAENLMIVDLLRNDLGRVARTGGVTVSGLFEVERYGSVWQMTSTVRARTDSGPVETLRALFPCGSVTGAPKVRTMEIIAELECAPRGVYTGAAGWLGPGRRACFNVAIRTVALDLERGEAVYGVGGGITWSSEAVLEWQETRLKARLLGDTVPRFELLETMLWETENGYALLDRHLARLAASAEYFGRPCDPARIRMSLEEAEKSFGDNPLRVRLLLDDSGSACLGAHPFDAAENVKPLRVGLAPEPVDSGDIFLFHKTTHRNVYERARQARPDLEEVILWNERDEVTESTTANIVVELEPGTRWTPPVDCGLLAGTLREELLDRGEIAERVIRKEELLGARMIWLINSVRGWMRAEICGSNIFPA